MSTAVPVHERIGRLVAHATALLDRFVQHGIRSVRGLAPWALWICRSRDLPLTAVVRSGPWRRMAADMLVHDTGSRRLIIVAATAEAAIRSLGLANPSWSRTIYVATDDARRTAALLSTLDPGLNNVMLPIGKRAMVDMLMDHDIVIDGPLWRHAQPSDPSVVRSLFEQAHREFGFAGILALAGSIEAHVGPCGALGVLYGADDIKSISSVRVKKYRYPDSGPIRFGFRRLFVPALLAPERPGAGGVAFLNLAYDRGRGWNDMFIVADGDHESGADIVFMPSFRKHVVKRRYVVIPPDYEPS